MGTAPYIASTTALKRDGLPRPLGGPVRRWAGVRRRIRDGHCGLAPMLLAVIAVMLVPAQARALTTVTARGGALRQGHERFHVYGYNYGPRAWRWMCGCITPTLGRDPVPSFRYFDHPTGRNLRLIGRDLSRMRRRGANTVRLYIELGHIMRTPTRTRARRLRALADLLRVAERRHVYLDITGNLVWRPWRSPGWYDRLSDGARWRVQARFWRSVARVGARSPAVLAYELTSEPVMIEGGAWYPGVLGGYHFGPNVARGVPLAESERAARSWIRLLRRAIRRVDRRHLIGLGMLPWAGDWAFSPRNVAPLLDVLFLHSYPVDGHVEGEISVVKSFAAPGKPVVLGETYPYRGSLETQRRFLVGSAPHVSGQLSFFLRGESGEDRAGLHYLAALRQFAGLEQRLGSAD